MNVAISMSVSIRLAAAHTNHRDLDLGLGAGACRLSTSPDGWMSPRASRCRLVLPQLRPDGVQKFTAPQDGASGGSTSLTPTPATTFLLDLWARPSTAAASLNRLPKLREFDSEEAQDSCLEGWLRPGLRGGGTTPISSTPWGLTWHAIPGFAHA